MKIKTDQIENIMVRVYINNNLLLLTQRSEGTPFEIEESAVSLIVQYSEKPKSLFQYIDKLEKNERHFPVMVTSNNLPQLWEDFKSLYQTISAAGGVVKNTHDEVLLIHRRGSWDLPKGKIDKGETPEMAAVREVQEETGLQTVVLGNTLGVTYHTYSQKEKRILKLTHWYAMETPETKLSPQTSEDIDQAVWVNLSNFLAQENNVFNNIRNVLAYYAEL